MRRSRFFAAAIASSSLFFGFAWAGPILGTPDVLLPAASSSDSSQDAGTPCADCAPAMAPGTDLTAADFAELKQRLAQVGLGPQPKPSESRNASNLGVAPQTGLLKVNPPKPIGDVLRDKKPQFEKLPLDSPNGVFVWNGVSDIPGTPMDLDPSVNLGSARFPTHPDAEGQAVYFQQPKPFVPPKPREPVYKLAPQAVTAAPVPPPAPQIVRVTEYVDRPVPGPERVVERVVPGPERIVERVVPGPERVVERVVQVQAPTPPPVVLPPQSPFSISSVGPAAAPSRVQLP